MKVKIEYHFHPEYSNTFFAYATVQGVKFIACHWHGFSEAKAEMIEKLQKAQAGSAFPVPPDEEIEI